MPTSADTNIRSNISELPCHPSTTRCRQLVQETLELISSKWAVPLVLSLSTQPRLRYKDLRNAAPGISPKELAKQLRRLESAGLIGREIHAVVPPHVEYWLTDLGHSLRPLLESLAGWAAAHGDQVTRSRDTFSTMAQVEDTPGRLVHRIR